MRELRYDVVPYQDGFAIMITPDHADAFAAKHEAFDAAVEITRKLRFVGIPIHVRVEHTGERPALKRAKAS
jgi:hypothetical protein